MCYIILVLSTFLYMNKEYHTRLSFLNHMSSCPHTHEWIHGWYLFQTYGSKAGYPTREEYNTILKPSLPFCTWIRNTKAGWTYSNIWALGPTLMNGSMRTEIPDIWVKQMLLIPILINFHWAIKVEALDWTRGSQAKYIFLVMSLIQHFKTYIQKSIAPPQTYCRFSGSYNQMFA